MSATAGNLVLTGMSPQADELQRTFDLFDADRDGTICFQELVDMSKKLGLDQSEEELKSMLKSVDTNDDGLVDFQEFLTLYSEYLSPEQDTSGNEDLKDAFSVFDKDQDGFITDAELHSVLLSLGLKKDRADVRRMIRSVDKDGDGRVNFHEFKAMMSLTLKLH